MTITHGAYFNTGSHLHGTMKSSQWDYSRTVQTFFGVTGEYHLQGRLHGRELTSWLMFSGFTANSDLQFAIDVLNALSGTYATMTWTLGATTTTFSNCVFNGFEEDEDPWLDGSGVNGWMVQGQLKFRQIKQ